MADAVAADDDDDGTAAAAAAAGGGADADADVDADAAELLGSPAAPNPALDDVACVKTVCGADVAAPAADADDGADDRDAPLSDPARALTDVGPRAAL